MKFSWSETGIVGLGGCIGSVARYQVNEWFPSLFGTFAVNVIGCFAIGILMYESMYFGAFSRDLRLLLGAGTIGSFTTFSAFATEAFQAGPVIGVLYIIANIFFGLTGVFLARNIILSRREAAWSI